MAFVIKYIKSCDFVGSDRFEGSLEKAKEAAMAGLQTHQADMAAVMDEANLDGAPAAMVTPGG